MMSPVPMINPTEDHLTNTLSLYLTPYHNPIIAHSVMPTGMMKNLISIVPVIKITAMAVSTFLFVSFGLSMVESCFGKLCLFFVSY